MRRPTNRAAGIRIFTPRLELIFRWGTNAAPDDSGAAFYWQHPRIISDRVGLVALRPNRLAARGVPPRQVRTPPINYIDWPRHVANFPVVKIIASIAAMQAQALRWKRAGIKIGFVPTMGYLHDGHMSLVRAARKQVGKNGKVVVSIYVNPTQFAPTEDLAKYPRDLQRDLKLCRAENVDLVFTPNDTEMYPSRQNRQSAIGNRQSFSTYVVEEKLSRVMEGASRPTHFRGVTTIVAKLFNLVLPDVAVFGQKDFQQAAIIKRMTTNLNFPVQIVVAPTRREADGLAMSSRNKYLVGNLRQQATILWRAIQTAQAAVKKSKTVSAIKLKANLKTLIEREPDAKLDYVEFFDPENLSPVKNVMRGTQIALAVFIGKTRLIDNAKL
jgi:pantoate--beta-alanine ligase